MGFLFFFFFFFFFTNDNYNRGFELELVLGLIYPGYPNRKSDFLILILGENLFCPPGLNKLNHLKKKKKKPGGRRMASLVRVCVRNYATATISVPAVVGCGSNVVDRFFKVRGNRIFVYLRV